MTNPYPPGSPDAHVFEETVRGIIEGLLRSAGDASDSVRQIASDVVTGEFLEKFAVSHGADPDASSMSASSQTLYWSTQSFKFDPSFLTFSPDAVQISPKGIEILGVNVTPGWTQKFEDLVHNLTPWNSQEPDQAGDAATDVSNRLKNVNKRVNGVEQRLGALRRIPRTVDRHDAVLRGLTRNQRVMAGSGATDSSRRSNAEMRQANRLSGQRNQSANARSHVYAAQQLRDSAQGLRRVEEEAARLERRLG